MKYVLSLECETVDELISILEYLKGRLGKENSKDGYKAINKETLEVFERIKIDARAAMNSK